MKKKGVYLLSIVFIFFVAFIQNAYAKAPKDPLHIYLSKSLGFVMGQRYSLNRIKAEYPVLSMQIKMAEIKFNSAFGIANKKIKRRLWNIQLTV